jgi:uncharacterized protein YciI
MSPSGPVEIRIIPNETIPERLFACFAAVSPEVGVALNRTYEGGESLPGHLAEIYREHLRYTHRLAEGGRIWEAGPSAGFTRILYIYATEDMDSAKQLMGGDPFYRAGFFTQGWWMEWSVHTPYWKTSPPMRSMIEGLMRGIGALPSYPPGEDPPISEQRVEVVTPSRLVVSLARADVARIKQIEADEKAGKPLPSFLAQHAFNRLGPGGSTRMGYEWESGPSADACYDLAIYSVGSIEMARLLRENDPFTQYGLFYEPDYFEWFIHAPFRKASPSRRKALQQLLEQAGAS